jgi:TPR repeat protein
MAIELYRAAADQDYPPAQYSLGEVYDQCPEMTNDNAEALGWYQKAADRGYAPAQRAIEWARQSPTNHA